MKALMLYRGDYPSEALIKKLIKEYVVQEPEAIVDELTLIEEDTDVQEPEAIVDELTLIEKDAECNPTDRGDLQLNSDFVALAPAPIGMVVFSGILTKKAAEKAGNLATKFNLPVYDAGQVFSVLDREGDKEILPFAKEALLSYGHQIVVAGALCKQLGIHDLYVPSYREDDSPIPKVAVVVKFARKMVLNATGNAVDVISPFSEMTEAEIKEAAKGHV